VLVAEADGNRTRLTRIPGHIGFEDRGEHQLPERLPGPLNCENSRGEEANVTYPIKINRRLPGS
jgi:hypothetical protein